MASDITKRKMYNKFYESNEKEDFKMGLSRKKKQLNYTKIDIHVHRQLVCAFCDLVDIDESTMKDMVRRYSGGAYKVCGAVMGAYVIVII